LVSLDDSILSITKETATELLPLKNPFDSDFYHCYPLAPAVTVIQLLYVVARNILFLRLQPLGIDRR